MILLAATQRAAEAATAVSLTNPAGGTVWNGATAVSTPSDLLTDPFTYNPNINFVDYANVPVGFLPNTAWNGADTLFIGANNDANNWWRADVTLTSGQMLDFIDIWGRSDYAGAEQGRHQGLSISFYNAPGGSTGGGTLLGTSLDYSGVSAKAANNANGSAYGRYDVTSLLNPTQRGQVQSFEITHGASNLNEFLLLTEVRAGSGTAAAPFPVLTINRTTGNATLSNNVGSPLNFIAYDVQSAKGSLNAANWLSVADTGDGNSGGSLDSNVWIEFSGPTAFASLSEGELPGGNGLTLINGGSINLGNIWRKSPYEDVSIQALKDDGTFIAIDVEFTGNGGAAYKVGDLNYDGAINATDWPLFRNGLGNTFDATSSLTLTYQQGDLDGDMDTDIADFRLFEAAYDGVNGGGALAATMAAIPEPSTLTLIAGVGLSACFMRRRRAAVGKFAALLVASAAMLSAGQAEAQTFTFVPAPADPATAVTANSEYNADYKAANMFTDAALTVADLGVKAYTDAQPQYAGVGAGPMNVFIDNGASINANWIAFAQRSGAIATADRIGTMDLWFSNTDFGGVLPATAPQATVTIDNPLGSTIKQYPLMKELAGRYVAMKMTIHPLAASGSVNNIGGHEFRFVQGPAPLTLQVNTTTGAITLKNSGTSAQSVALDAYQISSAAGSLNPVWTGLGGQAGFPEGNGSGNGWEAGGASDANLLTEAYLTGGSVVNTGASLSLGTGYKTAGGLQDLKFQYSFDNGIMTDGLVEYVSSTGSAADFDVDGDVDGADFLRWQRGVGIAAGATKGQGDADNNGAVNAADLTIWKGSFGGSATATAAAVPEPAACALAAVGAAAWGVGIRRRRA